MPVTILVQLSHMLISFQFIGIHKHFLQDNLVHGEGAFASLAMSGKNRLLVTDELVEGLISLATYGIICHHP